MKIEFGDIAPFTLEYGNFEPIEEGWSIGNSDYNLAAATAIGISGTETAVDGIE